MRRSSGPGAEAAHRSRGAVHIASNTTVTTTARITELVCGLRGADEPPELPGRALPLGGTALHESLEVDRGVLAAEQDASLADRLVAGDGGVLADAVEGIGGPEEGLFLGSERIALSFHLGASPGNTRASWPSMVTASACTDAFAAVANALSLAKASVTLPPE